MSLLNELRQSYLLVEGAGRAWSSTLLPSLHRLRTEGLTTDTCLVTVGEQGPGGAPLLAHSLVLAAASPTLAPILASLSDNEEITLILPGLEREEMEEVLEDIYLGRDKARVFLQEWGLWENGEENIEEGEHTSELVKELDDAKEDESEDEHVDIKDFCIDRVATDTTDVMLKDERTSHYPEVETEPDKPRSNRKCYTEEEEEDMGKNDFAKREEDIIDNSKKGKQYSCDSCNLLTYNRYYFIKHRQKKHNIQETLKKEERVRNKQSDDNCLIRCTEPDCIKRFKTNAGLISHLAKPHTEDILLTKNEKEKEQKRLMVASNSSFIPTVARNKHGYITRINGKLVHNGENGKLMCPNTDCIKDFTQLGMLKLHYEHIHQGNKAKCQHCGGEFSPMQLNRHIQRKHSVANLECEFCDYKTSVKSDLISHKGRNHDQTRHMCSECGQDYSSEEGLKTHVKHKHNGITKQCDQCDYKTTGSLSQLERHITIMHTGSKFICKVCPFIGITSEELGKHKLSFHDKKENNSLSKKSNEQRRRERELSMDFTCVECGHKLTSRQGLTFHINNIHRGIRFPCTEEGCDFKGTLKSVLQNHIQGFHKGMKHYCNLCDFSSVGKNSIRLHRNKIHNEDLSIYICDQCKYRCQDGQKMQKHMLNMHA